MEPQQVYWNIDKDSGSVLQALIHAMKPMNILEVGTSNGYSAIRMGQAAKPYGGHITTIEFFPERFEIATKNIAAEGLLETISVLRGDAVEILAQLAISTPHSFNCIFLDANKEEYAIYFRHAMHLICPPGIIIADNTISHANKLNEFFLAVKQEPRAHAFELPIGTGLMIIRAE